MSASGPFWSSIFNRLSGGLARPRPPQPSPRPDSRVKLMQPRALMVMLTPSRESVRTASNKGSPRVFVTGNFT